MRRTCSANVDDVVMKAFQALRALVAVGDQQHGDAEGMPDFEVVIRIADEKRASRRHAALAHEIVAALDFAAGKSVRDAEHEVEIVAQAELRASCHAGCPVPSQRARTASCRRP